MANTRLESIDAFRYRIPRDESLGMRTDVVVYASAALLEQIRKDESLTQAMNVAMLPGIVGPSLAMPDGVVYNVALAPHIDASGIALAALRKYWRNAEVERSLSWLVNANCSSAYSLAWRILALRSYAAVQPDVRASIEAARERLISLMQDPVQFAETTTLALGILALRNDMTPFALEQA